VAGTSADSNSPLEVRPRTVTVFCKGRNIFLKFAANSNKPVKACPRTITVRRRTCHGLLLSADVLAADYNSHVQKGGIGPSCRLSTCFLQVLLVLVFTFFKISFEWDTSFKFRLQI